MRHRRRGLTVSALVLTALATPSPGQENAWTSHGPTGVGVVLDVAASGSVAYAATIDGVFRSEDGGSTWEPAGLDGGVIDQIVAWPDTDVAFARSGSDFFITRDRGETWRAAVTGLPYPIFSTVTIDPVRPSTAYFGTIPLNGADIFRTTDAGATWEPFSDQPYHLPISAIAVDNSGTLFMTAVDQFHKSVDGGSTWEQISAPIPSPAAIATGQSGAVYAGRDGQICRSLDAWASWACSDFPSTPTRIVELPPDPPAVRVLVASHGGLYSSSDGGDSWTRVEGELGSEGYLEAIDAAPSGGLVLAGTASGVFLSGDRGASWMRASAGLDAPSFGALALDPQDSATAWAGGTGFDRSSGPGLFRSKDNGHSWSATGGPDGPRSVQAILFDPTDSQTIYAGGAAVYRSDDGGAHWSSTAVPDSPELLGVGDPVNALALDPASPDRIWAATAAGLLRSDDRARSFSGPVVAQGIYCLLVDGKRSGTMYAGSYSERVDTFYGWEFDGGRVFQSTNGGSSWIKGEFRFDGPVRSLAVDPFSEGVVYVGLENAGVYRSTDFGATWEQRSDGLPLYSNVYSLLADPVRPGRLYAADGLGVYRTTDDARTWEPFSTGLPSNSPFSLIVSPDGKWLYTCTTRYGVFTLDLVTRDLVTPPSVPGRRPRIIASRPSEIHPP